MSKPFTFSPNFVVYQLLGLCVLSRGRRWSKTLGLVFLSISLTYTGLAQTPPAPDWVWALKVGIPSVGYRITTDALGNSYVVGYFRGTFTVGNRTLTSEQGEGYVITYNATGKALWRNSSEVLEEV
jgi:hypothetical protein